jgi:hypothetical protein
MAGGLGFRFQFRFQFRFHIPGSDRAVRHQSLESNLEEGISKRWAVLSGRS